MQNVVFTLAAAVALGQLAHGQQPPAPLKPALLERKEHRRILRDLVKQENFAALEDTAEHFREKDPRYSSGVSKLYDLHGTLGQEFWGPLSQYDYEHYKGVYNRWIEQSPGSYLSLIAMSRLEMSRAWAIRGSARAAEVEDASWEPFYEHLRESMKWAAEALETDPRDPEVYSHMIDLCQKMSLPEAEARKWLARAIDVNPGYDSAYVSMANYLLPRWHGSAESLTAFAEESAESNEGLGDVVYARIATVALLLHGSRMPRDFPDLDWDRIRSGLLEIDRRYPDSARTFNLLARFATVFGDRTTARSAYRRLLNGGLERHFWDSASLAYARTWALMPDGDPER